MAIFAFPEWTNYVYDCNDDTLQLGESSPPVSPTPTYIRKTLSALERILCLSWIWFYWA